MEELFTIDELITKWKISHDTITRAIKKGELEGLKVGRCWRFTADQITSYLTKRTVSYRKRKTATLA